jgi:hypothetical protein
MGHECKRGTIWGREKRSASGEMEKGKDTEGYIYIYIYNQIH